MDGREAGLRELILRKEFDALRAKNTVAVVMLALVSCGTGTYAELADAEIAYLAQRIAAIVDKDAGRLQGIFKDIHQHPELGFMETRTAGIVARELKALGFEVLSGIGGTG